MDAKLLVILVASLFSVCAAFPYVRELPIPEKAFVPGVFIPTDVLKLFNEQAQDLKQENEIKDEKPTTDETPIKEEKPLKEEKEHNHEVEIAKSSDQVSTVYKPEEQQQIPQLGYQNTVNQQNPVDQSKLSQNLNQNLQGSLHSQPEYTPNSLPYQQQGAVSYAQTPNPQAVNREPWNNQAPNLYYVPPNDNLQGMGYNPNNLPQNGYYQPQNVVNQQPNLYNQQRNSYSQQPNIYNQQPNAYTQQPNVYSQQPNAYYQQPVQYNQQPAAYNQQPILYSQQPNVYNAQPVYVPQPASNQQLFVPSGPNPKLNAKPSNPGVVLNPNQNQPNLYTMVPINGNQNVIPNNNSYFIPVQQAQPNTNLLNSTKAEED